MSTVLFSSACGQSVHPGDGQAGAADVGTDAGGTGSGGSPVGGSGSNTATGGYGGTTQPCPTGASVDCTRPTTSGGPYTQGQTCDEEGNLCEGSAWLSAQGACLENPYSYQCCEGRWVDAPRLPDGSAPKCRAPGDPFACGDTTTCVVGEAACLVNYPGSVTQSCEALCPAADCSCYCEPDDTGACVFDLPDEENPEDGCYCTRDLGAISVHCVVNGPLIPKECERDPEGDASCPNADTRGTAYRCTSTPENLYPAPRIACDFFSRVDWDAWYCCENEP